MKLSKSVEQLPRNGDLSMTKNEHIRTICCRPEVAGDPISGENVQIITIEGYALLNFEAASISTFRENQYQPFA